MSLLNFLKKKKPEKEKKETKKETEKKGEFIEPLEKERKEEKGEKKEIKREKPTRVNKRSYSRASLVLDSPHITEKATEMEKENKYIFKVSPKANKIEIKKAIEATYGIDVLDVNIINVSDQEKT